MRILLTNDDGIYAPGLLSLYKVFCPLYKTFVVAPESEQSAVGHAISLSSPLRVKEVYRNGRFYGHAVAGTPADAVKIAIHEILLEPPDMVISGINLGPNVGINLLYSGTVSAATESAILGLPAIAVSLNTYKDPDFSYAAKFIKKLIGEIKKRVLPKGMCLNVNIPALPASKIKGIAFTKQATIPLNERFEKRTDPHQRIYYWQIGNGFLKQVNTDTDVYALSQGIISITPIHYDLTHYPTLAAFTEDFSLNL